MSLSIRSSSNHIKEVTIGEKHFKTPIFFPSISSFGMKIPINITSSIIAKTSFPRLLVSSYDLHFYKDMEEGIFNFLEQFVKRKILFIDSGCYESYWFKDTNWKFENYLDIVKKSKFDIYTTFDVYPDKINYNFDLHFKKTLNTICDSDLFKNIRLMFPILHENNSEQLINLLKNFIKEYPNKIISIAFSERELGYDIIGILKNIIQIRKILDDYNDNIILHILGCGDPKSILLYTFFGVDSFDSRDWAKRVINKNNLMTYHISQLDLFNCDCVVCSRALNNYIKKLLLHNLLFYENLLNTMRDWINNNDFKNQLNNYFSYEFIEKIEKIS